MITREEQETVPGHLLDEVMLEAQRLSRDDVTQPSAHGVLKYLRRARANVHRRRAWEARRQ